jgi:hypothetical protein
MREEHHGTVFRDLAPDDLGGDDGLAAAGRRNEQRTCRSAERLLDAVDHVDLIRTKLDH